MGEKPLEENDIYTRISELREQVISLKDRKITLRQQRERLIEEKGELIANIEKVKSLDPKGNRGV